MFEKERAMRAGSGGHGSRDARRGGAHDGKRWMRRYGIGCLIGAVGLTAIACASGGNEGTRRGAEVAIVVQNNLAPARAVTLLAAPEGRPQTVLGSISPGETGTFALRTRLIPHRYRLIAELSTSARIVSRLIQIVSDGSEIRWNLELNMITTPSAEGG